MPSFVDLLLGLLVFLFVLFFVGPLRFLLYIVIFLGTILGVFLGAFLGISLVVLLARFWPICARALGFGLLALLLYNAANTGLVPFVCAALFSAGVLELCRPAREGLLNEVGFWVGLLLLMLALLNLINCFFDFMPDLLLAVAFFLRMCFWPSGPC